MKAILITLIMFMTAVSTAADNSIPAEDRSKGVPVMDWENPARQEF